MAGAGNKPRVADPLDAALALLYADPQDVRTMVEREIAQGKPQEVLDVLRTDPAGYGRYAAHIERLPVPVRNIVVPALADAIDEAIRAEFNRRGVPDPTEPHVDPTIETIIQQMDTYTRLQPTERPSRYLNRARPMEEILSRWEQTEPALRDTTAKLHQSYGPSLQIDPATLERHLQASYKVTRSADKTVQRLLGHPGEFGIKAKTFPGDIRMKQIEPAARAWIDAQAAHEQSVAQARQILDGGDLIPAAALKQTMTKQVTELKQQAEQVGNRHKQSAATLNLARDGYRKLTPAQRAELQRIRPDIERDLQIRGRGHGL